LSSGWRLVCGLCAEACDDAESFACESCGGPVIVRHTRLPAKLATTGVAGLWRYRGWLPLTKDARAVTLGEGATPLVRCERWPPAAGLQCVYAKLEFAGPTGSFKDRGASVLVSHAVSHGVTRVVEDSSGNAGAAIAAYAACAGLACQIFAPAATPPSKLSQIRAYGANLIAVEGSREAVAAAARAAAIATGDNAASHDVYYASHNSNPYFVEGAKTLAFELVEQLGDAPDHIVLPVGGGSLFCGIALALKELSASGLIRARPRLHLVQSTGCMPLVAAFERGALVPLAGERYPTIAGGIVIDNPHRGALILRMLRETGGCAVGVADDEILAAQRDVARLEGIYMEPTSAVAFAGLLRLVAMGTVASHESVVVPVTGSGLKDSRTSIPLSSRYSASAASDT